MIKLKDKQMVTIAHGTGRLERPATCIAIFKKDKYNMCLFETEKGNRTCINDYSVKRARKHK